MTDSWLSSKSAPTVIVAEPLSYHLARGESRPPVPTAGRGWATARRRRVGAGAGQLQGVCPALNVDVVAGTRLDLRILELPRSGGAGGGGSTDLCAWGGRRAAERGCAPSGRAAVPRPQAPGAGTRVRRASCTHRGPAPPQRRARLREQVLASSAPGLFKGRLSWNSL